MSNKRNRWLTGLLLAVGVMAFVGFSIILPFSGAFQQSQRPNGSPTPSPRSSPAADLEAQAKGYEMVLQREPENQTALRGLVETRIQQGKIDAVLEPLQKLADLNPNQPDYGVLLAQTKQRLGDREAAAELYRNLLAKYPGNVNALKGLSDLLIEEQRPEAAVGLLQDTIKTADEANKAEPGTIDVSAVQLLLGEVYARQGRFDEALATYDRVMQSNSQDFRPLLGKAIVMREQGKTEEAKALFTSAAELAPAQFKDQINKLAALPSPTPASPAPDANVPEASPVPEANSAPEEAPAASPAPEAGEATE